MIRHDAVSKLLIILAMMFCFYLATWETTTIILFPGMLLMAGLLMEIFLEVVVKRKREIIVEPLTEEKSLKSVAGWTVVAIMGFFLIAYGVKFKQEYFTMSIISAVCYTGLMAIAEEQFFRGFITDFQVSGFPSEVGVGFFQLPGWLLALLSSAGIFTIYHLARYGGNPEALMYVFGGGFILSWVAYKSKRISPCMLGHLINNVVAILGLIQIV